MAVGARWDTFTFVSLYALRVARIVPCLLLLLAVLTVLHLVGAPNFTIPPERASLGRRCCGADVFTFNIWRAPRYLPGGLEHPLVALHRKNFLLLFPLVCAVVRSERLLIIPLLCLMSPVR